MMVWGYVSFHSSLNTTTEAPEPCRRSKNTNTHLVRPAHTVDAAPKSGRGCEDALRGGSMGRPRVKEHPVSTLDNCLPEGKHGKLTVGKPIAQHSTGEEV